MRLLLIVGLLTMVGCATTPNPGTMEWSTVLGHPAGASAVVKDEKLVLSGRAIRSRAAYAAPLTVECELQSGQVSSNGSFYIDFVSRGCLGSGVATGVCQLQTMQRQHVGGMGVPE